MKKCKLLLLVIILCLSGCVKSTTTLSIGADRSVLFSGETLLVDSIYDDEIFDFEYFIKNGGIIQEKSENGYTGIVFSKKYTSIDDISTSKEKEIIISNFLNKDFDDKVLFKVKNGFFKNIYYANYKYEAVNKFNNEVDSDTTDTNDTLVDTKFKYIVNLPVVSLNNNATTVSDDGMSLFWDIEPLKTTDIIFSFELVNTNNIIFLITSIIVVLGIIIFLTVFLNRHKNDHIGDVVTNDSEPKILDTDVIVNDNDKMPLN